MPLTREQRKLLHTKSNQPQVGNGYPNRADGKEGDIQIRKITGKGIVQYAKINGKWNEL